MWSFNQPIESVLRNILIILSIFVLSGCGFHLRGHNLNERPFPFTSLYLKGGDSSPFMANLRDNLELYKIKLTDNPAQADLTLQLVHELRDKQINVLSSDGSVLEFGLRYTISMHAYDKTMRDWLPPDEINLQRNLSYDKNQVLAKEMEEQMLFRDMVSDAVQQVLRRLSRAKPRMQLTDKPAMQLTDKPAAQPPGQPAPAKP
jgi:LPS-assembly lipoprotein